jgi:hypothetical protein
MDWQQKGSSARQILVKKKNAKSIVKVLEQETEVLFPFQQPYDCQVKMIESVIKCIANS